MGEFFNQNNWLTFDEAREFVRDESLGSVKQYKEWWDWNRPRQIPKYPYNVWKREWLGWNDFLGNNNVFDATKRSYRPYLEGVAYAHGLHLKSQRHWFEHCKDVGIPTDVPAHPELIYDTWVSWNHWLGNKAAARIEEQKKAIADAGYLYIVHLKGRPSNVFRIGVILGKAELGSYIEREGGTVIKLFKMEPGYDWAARIAPWAASWWEDDAFYVVSNINEMVFEVGSDLLFA